MFLNSSIAVADIYGYYTSVRLVQNLCSLFYLSLITQEWIYYDFHFVGEKTGAWGFNNLIILRLKVVMYEVQFMCCRDKSSLNN